MSIPTISIAYKTIVDILRRHADNQPRQRALTFLLDGKDEAFHATYAELDEQARSIAAQLQERVEPGDRALLLHNPGLSFVSAFLGCLYAGVIAVPTFPPHPNKPLHPRLQAIIRHAEPAIVLTESDRYVAKRQPTTELTSLPWLITDELDTQSALPWQPPPLSEDTIAFLQYTSGSTAAPKGTIITHANLLSNLACIHQGFDIKSNNDTTGVAWLPPYHDMGLIGGILLPLYVGGLSVLFSPFAFLQQPLRWLEVISRYKATISGAPNFAYELCVERISSEQKTNLDLSCWQVASVGAEPVRAATLERFYAAFASCGFQREAFYPCYGMAEATLIVSGGKRIAPPVIEQVDRQALATHKITAPHQEDAQCLVGCGQSFPGHNIVIVDPETRTRCSPDAIGEIWVSGPSISPGYWHQPDETGATFRGSLTESDGAPFLRTGDLGFLKEGELFVTGRIKELIIIRGRNYYPQDVEQSALQSHLALNPHGGAAFSVEVDDAEQLVIACELQRKHRRADVEEVATAIRGAISQDFELEVYAVVLLRPGHMPKTTSGKVQRRACRTAFLEGSLAMIDQSVRTSIKTPSIRLVDGLPIEDDIQIKIAELLGIPPQSVDLDASVQSLGLSSLTAVGLKHYIETHYEVDISATLFFEDMSLRQLIKKFLTNSSF
ncbi:MAG: AMP-binding protein [Anaerolineae bacterium]|nr:AMP-binding protein [Anaerolineae bacterium]